MTRVPGWVRFAAQATWREWARFLLKVGLLAGFVGAVLLFVSIEITEQPRFCRSCHIMEPYYLGWATSTHKDVPCIDCHYEPGLRSTFWGKMQGIRQVVVYFTGGAGTRPWAEISDASCLRSGCHETRLLEGDVDFHGIKFDHAPHLLEMRRGKKLRCTSCHSQIVQGAHISVTTATCILCHFKDRPTGDPVAGCLGCHHVPSDTITLPGGLEYLHANYVGKGVACVSCHATATAGDGFVPSSRCYVCHNIPDVEKRLADPESLHRNHVTEHKVECTDCHEEITHGYESERRVARLDCRGCHLGMHEATVDLAQGDIVGVLGETRPHVGPMLSARVECLSCHVRERAAGTGHDGATRVGSSEGCVKCHGERGGEILGRWNAFFARRIPAVEAAIRASRAGDSAVAQARALVRTVRLGRPVHNPSLARDLLDAAERLARGEDARLARPVAERDPAAGLDCSYCHLAEPERPIRFQGLEFPHRPHVRHVGLRCDKCHEGAPSSFPKSGHGRVRITGEDCRTCHHWQTVRCSGCHGDGPDTPVVWNGISFPHPPHVRGGVACATCHRRVGDRAGMGVAVRPAACAACHHRAGETRLCARCHEKTLPETVPFRAATLPHAAHVGMGLGCGDCHASGDSGVVLAPTCGMCHHQTGKPACAACHAPPPETTSYRGMTVPHRTHAESIGCTDCHGAPDPKAIQPVCETCHGEGFLPEAGG